MFLLLIASSSIFGQTGSEQFINSLVGKWSASDSAGYTLEIVRDKDVLLVTEKAAAETGKFYIIESRIYLDGRLQKDNLKQAAAEARTIVKNTNLTTTFYGLKNGSLRELFKERLSVKKGNLVRVAQIKFGVPFLAAGTTQIFRKITN